MESAESDTLVFACLRDGGTVQVDAKVYVRSQLIQKLGHPLPSQLNVPFSQQQIEGWSRFSCRLEQELPSYFSVLQVRASFLLEVTCTVDN